SALAQKGADLGSAIANDVLGVMYQAGTNFKPDFSKAASYFKVAADKGYLRADARLCYLAADAEPVPFTASYDEIVRYCTLAATSGDALGEATLGYLYENGGYGLQVDLTRAEYLYKEAADQNFVTAQVLLGALQYRGPKAQQDPAGAFALFQKAAARGYPAGLRWLAIAYELGIGTPVDIPHAGQLYDQAGAANDVVAAFLLGYKVADGTPATAIVDNELNRFGDAPTDPVGLRILGQLFERGFNRTMDVAQAVATYQRCAGTNALCQFILGSYFKYRAPTADLVAAARLYQQGAAAGEMHSQFELGYMYETGEGEPKDLQKAAALYTAAAQQGNGVARDRLAHLNSGSASP
ncbi:MAG TPA: tetratricopeptide repeat protein, partial [Devosia sp.]|nr:tetratricopeptide repeat protein [Devosia sp.]